MSNDNLSMSNMDLNHPPIDAPKPSAWAAIMTDLLAEMRKSPSMREWADRIEAAQAGVVGTPASRWRLEGKPDPHGDWYDGERTRLCLGHLSDDEIANAVYLDPAIFNLTAAKERIRWLSRGLERERAKVSELRNTLRAVLEAPRNSKQEDLAFDKAWGLI